MPQFEDETMEELMREAADQGQTQWAGEAGKPVPGPFDGAEASAAAAAAAEAEAKKKADEEDAEMLDAMS